VGEPQESAAGNRTTSPEINDTMGGQGSEILQGTLDLRVLKTLDAMGPLHGYSITHAGRRQLVSEAENWRRVAGLIGRCCTWPYRGNTC
jgi:hypothetical protein